MIRIVLLTGLLLVGCHAPSESVHTGKKEPDWSRILKSVDVAPPQGNEPLAVRAFLYPSPVAPGDPIHLMVKIRMAEPWHIYALDNPGPGVATKLHAELGPDLAPAGEWISPEPAPLPDGNRIHEGTFAFRRALQVRRTAEPDRVEASCELTYQACDPLICWPPRTMNLTAGATIEDPAWQP